MQRQDKKHERLERLKHEGIHFRQVVRLFNGDSVRSGAQEGNECGSPSARITAAVKDRHICRNSAAAAANGTAVVCAAVLLLLWLQLPFVRR
jgi:hypothetical protein